MVRAVIEAPAAADEETGSGAGLHLPSVLFGLLVGVGAYLLVGYFKRGKRVGILISSDDTQATEAGYTHALLDQVFHRSDVEAPDESSLSSKPQRSPLGGSPKRSSPKGSPKKYSPQGPQMPAGPGQNACGMAQHSQPMPGAPPPKVPKYVPTGLRRAAKQEQQPVERTGAEGGKPMRTSAGAFTSPRAEPGPAIRCACAASDGPDEEACYSYDAHDEEMAEGLKKRLRDSHDEGEETCAALYGGRYSGGSFEPGSELGCKAVHGADSSSRCKESGKAERQARRQGRAKGKSIGSTKRAGARRPIQAPPKSAYMPDFCLASLPSQGSPSPGASTPSARWQFGLASWRGSKWGPPSAPGSHRTPRSSRSVPTSTPATWRGLMDGVDTYRRGGGGIWASRSWQLMKERRPYDAIGRSVPPIVQQRGVPLGFDALAHPDSPYQQDMADSARSASPYDVSPYRSPYASPKRGDSTGRDSAGGDSAMGGDEPSKAAPQDEDAADSPGHSDGTRGMSDLYSYFGSSASPAAHPDSPPSPNSPWDRGSPHRDVSFPLRRPASARSKPAPQQRQSASSKRPQSARPAASRKPSPQKASEPMFGGWFAPPAPPPISERERALQILSRAPKTKRKKSVAEEEQTSIFGGWFAERKPSPQRATAPKSKRKKRSVGEERSVVGGWFAGWT